MFKKITLFGDFTKHDKYIHKGGTHNGYETWNRIDMRMILHAAQHRLYLTAFGVGMLAFLAGFGICWLAFVR